MKKFLWKISVPITPDAEDAISQLLEKLTGQPAVIHVDSQRQTTTASLYLDATSAAAQSTQAALRSALKDLTASGLRLGPGRIQIKKLRREDWAESWKRHFKPLEIGSRLLLKPSWNKRKPKTGQALVVLDPGLSFGTGHHPTTRFCLEQLANFRDAAHCQSCLDIGTGSGILAIAAAKLGFRPVVAVDFDPEAVRIAQANARTNRIGKRIRFACEDLNRWPLPAKREYDLVCANLIFDLLVAQADRIVKRLKPGGVLVLAGILRSQFAGVRKEYEKRGLRLLNSKTEKEWASGAFA
jgi:ribosomal protein L11 methyltransferase